MTFMLVFFTVFAAVIGFTLGFAVACAFFSAPKKISRETVKETPSGGIHWCDHK